MRKTAFLLMLIVAMAAASAVQAEQYGIGRFERLQTMATDLTSQTRSIYLAADRGGFPRFRNDNYVISSLYRMYDESARFRKQLERNYDDPEALRRAYQRLYSAWYNADYVMSRTNRFGYLSNEFRSISYRIHQLGRSLPGSAYQNNDRYRYNNDYDNDYDYDQD